jgi:hypothetical protein
MSKENMIDHLFDNNIEKFRNEVRTALYAKAGEYMQNAKQELAASMMNEQPEEVQEEKKKLSKEQLAAVRAPHNKITRGDIIALAQKNAKKSTNEGYAYPEGEVEDDCFEKCHEKNVHGKGGNEYHNAFEDCVKRCKKKG